MASRSFLFGLVSLGLSVVRGDLVTAAVRETVKLSPEVLCGSGAAGLNRRLQDDTFVPVAVSMNGGLKPTENYGSRLNMSSSGVFLKDINHNDNGIYEFLCGGDIERIVQLEVLAVLDISASEGDAVTLPCFSSTLSEAVRSVQWETDGEVVIRVDRSDREECGERFRERVSLPAGWQIGGDLSLRLERVRMEDPGKYYCHVLKGSKERGNPAAWRLEVHQKRSKTKTSTSPPETQICSEHTWKIIALVVIGILVVQDVFIVLFLLCDKFRSAV